MEIELRHVKERQAAGIALAKQYRVYPAASEAPRGLRRRVPKPCTRKGLRLEIASALGVQECTVFP